MEGTVEEFERFRGGLTHPYVESILDLYFPTMRWSDDDVILDIGCGSGTTTKNVLLSKCPNFKKIVAIDINPDYIEFAKRTYYHEKIEYKTQDVLKCLDNEQGGKYDKIVSFFVLRFIPDYEKFFSVISSILKPGGYFAFITIVNSPLFSILRELSADEEWSKYIKKEDVIAMTPPIDNWKDPKTELKNLVSKFGLRVTKCDFGVINLLFPDENSCLELYMAIANKNIFEIEDTDVKYRLRKQVKSMFLKHSTKLENGQFSSYFDTFHVCGIKTI